MVKQEMARVNVDSLGVGELRWTGMGELTQMKESLRVFKLLLLLLLL